MKRKEIDVDHFIDVCRSSQTMSEAATRLGMHFNTFKKHAQEIGCYEANQGGRGTKKSSNETRKIPLEEILGGQHPSYQTHKLKNRLIKEGIFKDNCSSCGIDSWSGHKIVCELDHINGRRTDHRLDNLRLLCPNCHSQTPTFRSKNRE